MCIISHLTLAVADWLRNKGNKKMLCVFRRVLTKSPEGGGGNGHFSGCSGTREKAYLLPLHLTYSLDVIVLLTKSE